MNVGRLQPEDFSLQSCDQTGRKGPGVSPRAEELHKRLFLFLSHASFTENELCVSVFRQREKPFIMKSIEQL